MAIKTLLVFSPTPICRFGPATVTMQAAIFDQALNLLLTNGVRLELLP